MSDRGQEREALKLAEETIEWMRDADSFGLGDPRIAGALDAIEAALAAREGSKLSDDADFAAWCGELPAVREERPCGCSKSAGIIHEPDCLANAAAREDTERQDGEQEFIAAADWLVRCLKDVVEGKVVRGLPEAEGAYHRTRAALVARDTEV